MSEETDLLLKRAQPGGDLLTRRQRDNVKKNRRVPSTVRSAEPVRRQAAASPVPRSAPPVLDYDKLAEALAKALLPVLKQKPQQVTVEFPDEIRTVPAETENIVVDRDDDGFVRRTITRVRRKES